MSYQRSTDQRERPGRLGTSDQQVRCAAEKVPCKFRERGACVESPDVGRRSSAEDWSGIGSAQSRQGRRRCAGGGGQLEARRGVWPRAGLDAESTEDVTFLNREGVVLEDIVDVLFWSSFICSKRARRLLQKKKIV